MAAVIVQSKLNQVYGDGTTSGNIVFDSSVTNGNAVIIGAYLSTGATLLISGYTNDSTAPSGFGTCISKRNVSGVGTTIAFTVSGAGARVVLSAFEVSGLDNLAAVTIGNHHTGTSQIFHDCADDLLAATGFGIAGGTLNGTGGGTISSRAPWTLDTPSSGVEEVNQHATAIISPDSGRFDTTIAIDEWMCMAIYAIASAPATGLPFITTLGAKRI